MISDASSFSEEPTLCLQCWCVFPSSSFFSSEVYYREIGPYEILATEITEDRFGNSEFFITLSGDDVDNFERPIDGVPK